MKKNIKSHFRFDKQERNGIFFLMILIVVLQCIYFFIKQQNTENYNPDFTADTALQSKVDSLRQIALSANTPKQYPFNPNFISDYKGYTLGMSPTEIDRLHQFREEGRYVNSAKEFQKVTQISDSLLSSILPYFKFPEWTKKSKKQTPANSNVSAIKQVETKKSIVDLNRATQEQLQEVYGIGEKLSIRIIKFRNRLGGFLVNEQLYDVYGLDDKVARRALERFQVLTLPSVTKININTASVQELSSLVYISRQVAQNIIGFRNQNGPFKSMRELKEVSGFPSEKIDRIGLYLSVSND